ncbi:hypothetical protein [Burkholderia sp. SRS-W-2-2016]|uniref:hypothetical protein n=1 Tax=Burkholderia sp. SRS-W-2-2016 TaxID=1926878 RepID=UPI0015BE087A|nr:hypothetical protein [Burkholderia sp. SRS-W-2-2016]
MNDSVWSIFLFPLRSRSGSESTTFWKYVFQFRGSWLKLRTGRVVSPPVIVITW